ncbi:MAG: class A beta-lactamase-related serine hydrolase [Flavobacteriaceae bacterium TMED42]|nr:MAG: class A beta-lactamase-related serine hydrolase [Flavobacteriaceae bacterium TMED42]|tara:strand:+ start:3244 stop:4395 length:1152 start_codon:yes stop_codon:yes gene_type:complete
MNFLYSQQVQERINKKLLQEFQKELIADGETGGNVILVSKNGKTIYHHIENSNKKGDEIITDETLFPIWSMSKPITTVAVLILREQNLINFNDPVSKFIPAFKNLKCKSKQGVVPCKKEIKIIHLLTHLSGLYYYNDFMLDAIRANSLADLMEDIVEYPLEFEPGERYLYGLNQDVLGRVVEVASGMPFADFLKKFVFDPLEMNQTKFFLSLEEKKLILPLYVSNQKIEGFNKIGITGINDLISYDIKYKPALGSLGLISTLEDYSNFCSMLLNQGVFKNKRILSEESISELKVKYADGPHSSDVDFLGVYNGLGVYVLEDPSLMDFKAPKGLYGHGGYQSTEFFIDTKNETYGVFLNRSLTDYNHRFYFIKAVYDAFSNQPY